VYLLLVLAIGVLAACATAESPAPVTEDEAAPDAADPYVPTAASAPSTDIWIGSLSGTGTDLTIRNLRNVTDRDGYDNQPAFLTDGSGILYTSGRDDLQTDIFRYDIETETTHQVTDTASSEFSATPLPDGGFSTIHEASGEQLLWRFDDDGTDGGSILPTVQPVGYQAWANSSTVAMFVLGDPPTLQIGDLTTGEATAVAENIGRSLHKVPGAEAISFVDKGAGDVWWIRQFDLDSGEIGEIIQTLAGREDMAWTPEGVIVMGDGSELYAWQPGGSWWRIADLSRFGVVGITRLAVSPAGDRIAIVAERPAPTPADED
jgi:hypothetical protein